MGTALPWLPFRDWLTHTSVDSKVQKLLFWVLQLVGIRDSSLTLMTTGPARPPALGVDGHEGGHLSLASVMWQVRGGARSPTHTSSG